MAKVMSRVLKDKLLKGPKGTGTTAKSSKKPAQKKAAKKKY